MSELGDTSIDKLEADIIYLEKENERLWAALKRLEHRTDELRLAVPHVKFEDW